MLSEKKMRLLGNLMAPSHAKLNFLKYIKNGDSDTLEHSGVCMPILVFNIYLTISY